MAETASLSDAVAGRIFGLRPAPAEYFGGDAIVEYLMDGQWFGR